MAGTPIYDKMVADRAKKAADKAAALKPKKAPVGKETGMTKAKGAKPKTNYKRGK